MASRVEHGSEVGIRFTFTGERRKKAPPPGQPRGRRAAEGHSSVDTVIGGGLGGRIFHFATSLVTHQVVKTHCRGEHRRRAAKRDVGWRGVVQGECNQTRAQGESKPAVRRVNETRKSQAKHEKKNKEPTHEGMWQRGKSL